VPEIRPAVSGRSGGLLPEAGGGAMLPPVPPTRGAAAPGRPGNRWPSARELAALLVNGILTLPSRYRRGMFLDVLI
jgi:hypothetical protein